MEFWNSANIILDGTVISTTKIDSEHLVLHDIKVNQYFKNPKPQQTITAYGPDVYNEKWFYPKVFDQGDRVLFYLKKIDDKYMILEQSILATEKCTPRDMIGLSTLPGEPTGRGGSTLLFDPYQTCNGYLFPVYFFTDLPPTKQLKSGIHSEDVKCKIGLTQVIKYDGSPVCVKPDTAAKLIQLGWTSSDEYTINLGGGNDLDIIKEQTIFLRNGIDDYDSGTSFNPIYVKSILGVDNNITWSNAKQEPTQIQSDEHLFAVTLRPQESFSFTFDSVGVHKYHDPINWKYGTVFVSTDKIESSNLKPAKLLQKNQSEIAKIIATTLIPDDKIVNTRLEDTMMSAYVTERNADIIVPKSLGVLNDLQTYDEIQYHYGITRGLIFPKDEQAGLDFAKDFLKKIGYNLDGSEWIDKVNFGDRIQVTIQQKIQGWIIPNHIVQFDFAKDHTWITLGRWYDDASQYEFNLSQDDAKKISKNYMDSEVKSKPIFQKYDYSFESISDDVRVIIFDDKPFYMVPITYKANADMHYEVGHCGSNQYLTVYVMVEGRTGTATGWNYPGCE